MMCWVVHLSSALLGDEQLLETLRLVDNAWLFWEMYLWEESRDAVAEQYREVDGTNPNLDRNNSTVEMITSLLVGHRNLNRASVVLRWLMAHPTPWPGDQIKAWKIYFTKCFTSNSVDPADTRGDDDEPYNEWNQRIRKKYSSHLSQFKDRLDCSHQRRRWSSSPKCIFCELRRAC